MRLNDKYRPRKFKDVIGQGINAELLQKQIISNKLAQAYLFEGRAGSGKTTSARILAKAMNCSSPVDGEPCGKCESCKSIENGNSPDVIEIDAASNGGIDNIRDIKENMLYAPTTGKYKIYIIDECHQLTQSASNAFLKILEEPPAYGKFILCTTDADKMLITILSRCQKYKFKNIEINDIRKNLFEIARNEKYMPKDLLFILDAIARVSKGAMRDAVSLLEQLISTNTIDVKEIVSILGLSNDTDIFRFLGNLNKRNSSTCMDIFFKVIAEGTDEEKFIINLIDCLRALLIIKSGANTNVIEMSANSIKLLTGFSEKITTSEIIDLLEIFQKAYSELKVAMSKKLVIEIAIMKSIEQLKTYSSKVQISNSSTESVQSEKKITVEKTSDDVQLSEEEKDALNRKKLTKTIKDKQDALVSEISKISSGMSDAKLKKSYMDLAKALEAAGFSKQQNENTIAIIAHVKLKPIISSALKVKSINEFIQKFFIIDNVQYKVELK